MMRDDIAIDDGTEPVWVDDPCGGRVVNDGVLRELLEVWLDPTEEIMGVLLVTMLLDTASE